jgi:hypothetical protein
MQTRRRGAARLAVLTTTAAVAALLTATAAPGWTRAAGLDVWNLPALEREMKAGVAESRRLDEELEHSARRQGVKEALVANLIAGRTTLAEVVADFAELDRCQPWFPEALRVGHPGRSDREVTARAVVEYALSRVADPAKRAEVRRRLEAELQSLLAQPDDLAAPTHVD